MSAVATSTATYAQRQAAFKPLVEQALDLVAERYGDMAGRQGANVMWLLYHGRSHSRQVATSSRWIAEQMAHQGAIDARDIPLAELAGAWHDVEQMMGPGTNERVSGEMCVQAMRDAGLFESGIVDERDAEKIMEMINGTAVTFDAQGIMHQAARPENRLQAAVGDADMAGLGTSNGPMQRVLLFVEIQAKQGKLKLPGTRAELVNLPIDEQAFAAYMRGQVLLDENHEYMTAAARAAYTKGLERNAEWTRDCAEKTSTGEWNFADALQSAEKMWQMSVSDPSRSAPEPPSARQSLVGIGV